MPMLLKRLVISAEHRLMRLIFSISLTIAYTCLKKGKMILFNFLYFYHVNIATMH